MEHEVTPTRQPSQAAVTAAASARSGASADLLGGFLDLLTATARSGRPPAREDLERAQALGARAAERQVGLRNLVDLYLTAAEHAWTTLPGVADAATSTSLRAAGTSVLAATGRVVLALVQGYEASQQAAVAQEQRVRQEFIDDLLYGRSDLGRLAERAERFGVTLAGTHLVAVARAERSFTDTDSTTRQVETNLVARFGVHNILVTTRDGLLVCIAPSGLRGAAGEFAHQLLTALGSEHGWQIGVGRPHAGPGGVVQSYEEARGVLRLADKLGFRTPVLHAADLLVFPVLLRDQAAITDLVRTVLGPLDGARGGAQPLLDTLAAFFDCQGNHAATARRLNISTRAVTYRLERVRRLSGYAATQPTQRFTLEAAVLGARLLDWPAKPLASPP
jgi:DNA-binding PucR family transcriptional regulator